MQFVPLTPSGGDHTWWLQPGRRDHSMSRCTAAAALPIYQRRLCVLNTKTGTKISSDLTAAISHQPLSCSTNPFSPSTLLHLPPDILMAQNWPSHYGHIKLKWPPNGIGMIFFKWRESDFCHDRLSPMETTGRESDRWTTFLCQNDVKRKIIIVG